MDKAPKLSERFEVQAVPTLLVIRDGEVVARRAGAGPPPACVTGSTDALGWTRQR